MSKSFYDVLWVDKWASQDEIKKAYRKQAMKYHPDRNKWDETAEKKFKEVNEAYGTIWDEQKRKQAGEAISKALKEGGNPFSKLSKVLGHIVKVIKS